MELSSRRSSRELPELLHALSTTLAQFRRSLRVPEPKDAVLASNMISVGVDVPRLGLMVVNGQPKSTAEYIQASSRVGRGIPGLVVTLYNFGRPRDLSHFEHFRAYHSALYRSVEATSVTPWAPRARDKALHAVLASVVRHLVPGLSGDDDAIRFDPGDPEVAALVTSILARVAAASDGLEARGHAGTTSMPSFPSGGAGATKPALHPAACATGRRRLRSARRLPHLMCSAEEGAAAGSLAWPTPNTMREVEPSTAFVLKAIHAQVREAHSGDSEEDIQARPPARQVLTPIAGVEPLGKVRRSQLIATYGIGAIIDLEKGSFMPMGLEDWEGVPLACPP